MKGLDLRNPSTINAMLRNPTSATRYGIDATTPPDANKASRLRGAMRTNGRSARTPTSRSSAPNCSPGTAAPRPPQAAAPIAATQEHLERKKKLYSQPRGGNRERLLSGMMRSATGHPSLSAYAFGRQGPDLLPLHLPEQLRQGRRRDHCRPRLNLQRPRRRTATRNRAFLRRCSAR